MKKILFVINTLGTAGAEKALIELLTQLDKKGFDISLFVLMNQGDLINDIPKNVKILNTHFDLCPIHGPVGKKHLMRHTLLKLLKRGAGIKYFGYIIRELAEMKKQQRVLLDKLMWQPMAYSAKRFSEEYDLAVAYTEGGSSYYVSQYVKAVKKVCFIHTAYTDAGYRKSLDNNAYAGFDKIFGVSDEVKEEFIKIYPELSDKMDVFHNLIGMDKVIEKAETGKGFSDDYEGIRIVTIGRLNKQKALEVSIAAAARLKENGIAFRWYVFGEGDERKFLESEIERLSVKEEFLLCGNVENPYPYIKQCDIYAHASKYEGKSIAIQEAQILGKPIVTTDCNGNREQIENEYDGLLCEFDSDVVADNIMKLINDKEKAKLYGERSFAKISKLLNEDNDINKLLAMIG